MDTVLTEPTPGNDGNLSLPALWMPSLPLPALRDLSEAT